MKESTLIEMQRNLETVGKVAVKISRELEQLKMIVMGDHEVIKQLSEFPEIITKMQTEAEAEKDKLDTGETFG